MVVDAGGGEDVAGFPFIDVYTNQLSRSPEAHFNVIVLQGKKTLPMISRPVEI